MRPHIPNAERSYRSLSAISLSHRAEPPVGVPEEVISLSQLPLVSLMKPNMTGWSCK